MEFGFSWFAGKVMIKFLGQGVRQIVVKLVIIGWWVVTTHTFDFKSLEVSQAFGFPYS